MARESLETARQNAKQEHWRAAYNRLYYACFYAAKALLEAHGHNARSHSGVKTMLSKHFVRTGALESNLGSFYGALMEVRPDSDYDVFFDPDPEQFRNWLPKAERFIERICALLDEPAA